MRRSRKFISLPIISLEEGQRIGIIKDIIINPIRKELAAILVEQRGWFKEQKIIPYSKVRSAGVDAITVEKSSSVDKAANFPEIMGFIRDKITILGARVITETGVIIGQVDEFWVDEVSGKILSLDVSGNVLNSILKGTGQLSIEHIRTIGKDLLVASEGAENLVTNLDGGLQDRVKSIKNITSQLLSTTWEKTKSLSKLVDEEYENSLEQESSEGQVENEEPDLTVDSVQLKDEDTTEIVLQDDTEAQEILQEVVSEAPVETIEAKEPPPVI